MNGFETVRKRLVQANACSGRPRRDPPGCGADGPAQHGPPRGRSRDRALLKFDRCAPASLLGFTPLPARCALGPASHESQCAARRAWPAGALRDGVDALCADRRRCAPWERGDSGCGGARACSRERVGARATPNPFNTLRTHVLQPAQSGASRACGDAPIQLGAPLRACFAPDRRSVGGAAGRARFAPGIGAARAARQATWLILPVVICLSQRLSHACLSISDLYCETANGSLNQLWSL